MCFDTEFGDSYFGFLAGILAGHVPFQGNPSLQTTIDPSLLTQPSRVVAFSEGSTQNGVANHDMGYSAMGCVPQQQYNPLPWPANHPRCPFLEINDDLTTPHTGATRARRRRFRGARVDNAVPTPCQWESQDSLICGQEVTGPSVPNHLARHGIQNMGRDCVAQCCWHNCGVEIKRQGMTRHYREVHLGLKRKSYAIADAPV